MTSRLGERTLGILAGASVIVLVMLIVLLWTGVGTGVFNNERYANARASQRAKGNYSDEGPSYEEMMAGINGASATSKKAVPLSIGDDSAGKEVEYVKPVKVSSPGLHEEDKLYGPDQWPVSTGGPPLLRHHSGHFRHKMAQVWDPHPQYEFTAFGRTFRLDLTHDSSFVSPELQVTHLWQNQTARHQSGAVAGCFYSGVVADDPHSSVAVSLCHGMTGHIHTTGGGFFIEPAEQWRDSMTPILHAVYRTQDSRAQTNNNVLQDDVVPQCGVIDDSDVLEPAALHEDPPAATEFVGNRTRRSVDEQRRRKRFSQYNIEIMVVADKKMAEYHGAGLNHYILSLMHTVNKFYKHASVGNPISIAVVKIVVLKDMDATLNARRKQGTLAPEYLRRFCTWQAKHNVANDDHVGHYDTALLLTRENLCRSLNMQKCDTLGLAEMGTMCHRHSSCSIVRDNGLSAAFTIAHELGHVLNMPHDDDERCRQYNSHNKMNNVMSRMLDNNTSPYSWSNCSRHFVTAFLDTGGGDCLLDVPQLNEVNTVPRGWLPGENFTENQQCELVNGPGSKICSYMPVCSKLWCAMDFNEQKGCKTNHMPWADGTACGDESWCQQGQCVQRDRTQLKPVDGGWGPWQEYGECSRTCGGGVKKGVRFCDNPRNLNGGQYCLGQKVRYVSCATTECPPGSKDFREVQCAAHNGNNFKIQGLSQDVTWVPKYGGFGPKERCMLYCRVAQTSDYYALGNQVKDGTRCGPDTFDICVNGLCKPAGCSHELNRDIKLDFCGKCGGDNSSCHWIEKFYNNSKYGYTQVVRIPAGSSNIDIRQTGHHGQKDDNYLALIDGDSGEYLLNGKYSVTNYPKVIPFAGAKLHYSGSDSVEERLNSSLPIGRDLVLEVLSVGKVYPPNISYKYTTMFKDYMWTVRDEWTDCDKVCNGERQRVIDCVRVADGLKVQTDHCSDQTRPAGKVEACNTYCTLKWHVWSRGECSSHCGPGFRTQSLQCVQETHDDQRRSPVQEQHCTHILHLKPGEKEPCEGPCDASHWLYMEWGQCTVTCGGGVQKRTAICVDDLEREVDRRQCDEAILKVENPCPRRECPRWVTGENWTPCSVSCGEGESLLPYYCQLNSRVVGHQDCHSQPIPVHRKPCVERPCVTVERDIYTVEGAGYTEGDEGLRTRGVLSVADNVIPNGADDYSNAIDSKLVTEKASWRTGPWGDCSRTCGGGVQRRLVKCQTDLGDSASGRCAVADKPKEAVHCANEPCPTWKYGMWGDCNVSCGVGYRHRQVGCHSHVGEMLEHDACDPADKERNYEECPLPACSTEKKNRWKMGAWGQCSTTCGSGQRRRSVECISRDGHCDLRTRPKTERGCKHAPCANSWALSDWTECSVTCGTGTQRRSAVCHAADKGHARSDTCAGEHRPPEVQTCHMPDCGSHFYWRAGDWMPCSHQCGKKGRQIRVISCYHRSDKKVPRFNCHNESKPKRKRKCNQKKCTTEYTSCLDVRHKLKTTTDREFLLSVDGRAVSIYCHHMHTDSPTEFLTLPNQRENYAEIYDRRLLTPDSCPRNGTRDEECDCVQDADGKAGLTEYSRIRLNITSLRVHTHDVTWAHQVKGTRVNFAESGDCYSRAACPQGRFSVDLKGTPFKVSRLTRWEGHGLEPTVDVRRHERDQRISGKCGGYCGTCSPESRHGLTLDWLQPP